MVALELGVVVSPFVPAARFSWRPPAGRHPRPREVPMPEPFALTCDSCGEPLLPNLSQADADGCLWICINPDCPELCAGELESEDLVEGGGGAAAPPPPGS